MRPRPWYSELLEELARPGCPACRGAARVARRDTVRMLGEGATNPSTRSRLRRAHGFCREHALLALELSGVDGQGVAMVYSDILRHSRGEAVAAARGRRWWQRSASADALDPHAECPVCAAARDRADTYLRLLADVDAEDELGRAARSAGRGLCLPHLRRGLERIGGTVRAERLLEIYLRGHDELAEQLEEYGRRFDHRYSMEPPGAEQRSWRRAVLRVVGLPHHRLPRAPGDGAG